MTPELVRAERKLSLIASACAGAGAALAATTMPTEMAIALDAFADTSMKPEMTVMGAPRWVTKLNHCCNFWNTALLP
ncbi:hypothetical protein TUM20985_11800 [Mycobacterium antarcticum]|nr:hypothetical protein TUM20985_11800 [Mycolicibacterium sp. TUM20985]GLP78528.1 hypothetical protein TUM20983_56380 [Mycolicibacterium sp. TUM20983]GLP79779.1 hypothetical protein TUM20984_11990 [Mycolicibacterium sp. TUM20984]